MKTKDLKVLIVLVTFFFSFQSFAQKKESHEIVLHPDQYSGPIYVSGNDFPKGNIINMVDKWGGLAVVINELPAGTDFAPLLKGLEDDLCQVPHWGYLEKGKIRVIDKSKKEVTIEAGSVFYMPPGHNVIVDEDAKIIDFSPSDQMKDLNKHVLQKVAEMESGQ
ncbi:MAG: cupin domain-containing protein [Bacteroidales bacterium]|nr:cupin domain-containing protein [Bacteroidales bacterium]